MIANARMYSVDAASSAAWREILQWVVARADVSCEVVDYPPPQPLPALWARDDVACVFMCGYPLARAASPPVVLAAPVPSPRRYAHQPVYWTDIVVRADSDMQGAGDVLGRRFAYTTENSQSGYHAPRELFAPLLRERQTPLFAALVGPLVTPRNVVDAVLAGEADAGPVDSYALDVMRAHDATLHRALRIVASTAPTPIPPLVAAARTASEAVRRLRTALADVGNAPELAQARATVLLERFVPVERDRYSVLAQLAHAADALGYPALV